MSAELRKRVSLPASDAGVDALEPAHWHDADPLPAIGLGQLAVLDDALCRAELQPLLRELSFTVDASLALPFALGHGCNVGLSPSALADPVAARVLVRHAAEIALLAPLAPQPPGHADRIATALLAARVAGLHLGALPRAEQIQAERALPADLLAAYRQLAADGRLAHVTALFGHGAVDIARLLQLGGLDEGEALSVASDLAARADAANLLARSAAVILPAELLITLGGDQRIAPFAETGRNGYGSSPRPAPDEISFASSTASPVSMRQLETLEQLRRELAAAALEGSIETFLAGQIEDVRARVLELAGASALPGCEAVLTASGTDAELLALSIVLSRTSRPVTSILIDPSETGSGVPQAAMGQHFSGRTAYGAEVVAGASIDEFAGGRVVTAVVALRDAAGNPRPVAGIDDEVARLAARAAADGRHVHLHVLDAAKTGLGAPSLPLVQAIARALGDGVTIVVDACQMRLGAPSMRAYLERGYLLQVTGSKFFCGPPFCGALLIPAAIALPLADAEPAPGALAAYSGRAEWPARLGQHASALAPGFNTGLLCRWRAALAEADAFARVRREDAALLLAHFARMGAAGIARHTELRAVMAPPFDRSALSTCDELSGLPTVLPFLLLDAVGQPFTLDDAKRAHKLLMQDLSAALGSDDAEAARAIVHLGQPVKMGHTSGIVTGALRLCSSARTVTDALLDRSPRAVLAEMALALRKAALVARHFQRLTD